MALSDLTNPITLPNGLDTANENPIAKAEKVVVTGEDKSVTDVIRDLRNASGQEITDLLSHLFGGATYEIDHSADTVSVQDGFSHGVDYRTNALGEVNDATHYVGDNITVSGSNSANTFDFTNLDTHRRLIALKLDIDNVGRTGDGAMIVMLSSGGTEYDFLDISTTNRIRINTTAGQAETKVNVGDASGDIVLNNNSSYWILIQIVPRGTAEGQYEAVIVVRSIPDDGTLGNSQFANDINLDLSSVTPSSLGISRSVNQVGRVDEFKFISHPSYITHTNLNRLLLSHSDDKWDFGYARLIVGSDRDKVTLASDVELEGNIRRPELVVYESSGLGTTIGQLVNTVTLPANYLDYRYIHVTEFDSSSTQWRHAEIPTSILTHVLNSHNIRLQGNTVMNWVSASRQLAMNPLVQEIFRVSLKD